jgi:aryl-alcohol dehydrogenase-like predicted oxidoreductase
VERRRLGVTGPAVSALGLGCMGMSGSYGRMSEGDAVDAIHRAIALGVTLLDTADVYGLGHNERLVGRAIADRRDEVVLATKFGNVFDEQRGRAGRIDGSREYVRSACEQSLRRLGVETIDLYQQHRVDPATPIEETVGALAELVTEGKIRHVGLSEAAPENIRRASAVHPIASVQSEYSLFERGVEDRVLDVCEELGIGFLAYAPLGRGILGGALTPARRLDEGDKRASDSVYPRVGPSNLAANARLASEVRTVADARGATMAQVALAWLLARRPFVVPIPGSKRVPYVEENVRAVDVELTPSDIDRLDAVAARVVGPRYGPERRGPTRISPPPQTT